MVYLFLIIAVLPWGTSGDRCWELPEHEPASGMLQDTLYDSLNMRFVGSWPFGPSYAVTVDSVRDLVFLGSGGGVYVLDVSTPSDPQKLSERIHTRGVVMDLSYDSPNENLYIADGDVTLEIWSVEDPANPGRLGWWDNPPPMVSVYLVSRDVTVLDSFAYVIDFSPAYGVDDGLHILNVSDPLSPYRVGFLGLPSALGFAISGSYAYVVCGDRGLEVVDISNPSNPQWECRGPDGLYMSITISDSYAYVDGCLNSGEKGFIILDISNHLNVHAVGCCSTIFDVKSTAFSDSYAYAATDDSGLYVINISDISNPEIVGHYDTPGLGEDIAITGLHAYIAEAAINREEAGLRVVDVSVPAAPIEMSYWDVPGVAEEIALKEPYAYVGTRDGLWVLDVSNRANPQELGHCHVCGWLRSMVISDSCAYIAASDEGLRIVDITNPATPQEVSHYLTPGFAQSVTISEPYVYVALRCSGFCVVDVSDPLNPEEVAVYESWEVKDMTVSGSCAYAVGKDGLTTIDICNPAAPVQIGSCDYYTFLGHVAVLDSHAYCLTLFDGAVPIFDISDPPNPVWTNTYQLSPCLWDVVAWNEWVAVALNCIWGGGEYAFCCPYLIDVSDPENPQTAGYYRMPEFCAGVAGADLHAYVVGGAGMQIYEFCGTRVEETSCHQPQRATLKVCPSLAFGIVDVSYRIPTEGIVSIVVSDVAGRHAKTLVNTFADRGDHSVAMDVRGFPVGIYFVCMTRGSEVTVTRKLTVIR
jgi:hypothetical protein